MLRQIVSLLLFTILIGSCTPASQPAPLTTATQIIPPSETPTPTQTAIPTTTPSEMINPSKPTTLPNELALPDQLNSSWIAFANNKYNPGIYLIRANKSEWRAISTSKAGLYEYLSWSPNGHQLVFTYARGPEAPNMQIYTVNIDGSNLRRLTFADSYINNHPVWSPDGKYIVYTRGHYINNVWTSNLIIIDTNGNLIRELTSDSFQNDFPHWTPDGKTIYYLSDNPDEGVLLMAIDTIGLNKRLLTTLPKPYMAQFALSSDGGQIFFGSTLRYPCGDFYTIDIDGKNLKEIAKFPGDGQDPSWSQDSHYLILDVSPECWYTLGRPAEKWELNILDVQRGMLYELTSNPDWYPTYPSWSPVPALQIGDQYIVTDIGDKLNLRDEASLQGKVVKQLLKGDQVSVLEGPLDLDGYYWWRLRTADGIEGWAVDEAGWYKAIDRSALTPTP